MSYDATNWPPLQIPPVTSSTGVGETVEPDPAPGSEIVDPEAEAVTWTAAAPPVNNLARLSPVATQKQIAAFFSIINPALTNEAD